MDPVTLILILVGLIAMAAIGWFVGARPVSALQAERAQLADRLATAEEMRNAALRDLAVEAERAGQARALTERLDVAQAERDAVRQELSALKAEQQARGEAFEAQIAALRQARDELSAQFSEIGGKLLGDAQRAFLERADQRFAQEQEKSGAALRALLQPVETTLKAYDEKISKVEHQRTEAYGNLKGLMEAMQQGQDAVRTEAQRLVNSLRAAPKARGRWGEQQLRNVLENCGLSEYADFQTEVSVDTGDGRLRPDVIIRIPGGRTLIVDAKVSLNAYQDAFGVEDENERRGHLAAHASAMRAHVETLGRKDYASQFDSAPDYVIMFVPGEHFLAAALEHDPQLWDNAFRRKVLLATPTNLVAIAQTVASVWRQERQGEDAKKIAMLGKELYERLAVASGHLQKMGRDINGLVRNYNGFVSSMETRVMVTGRKLKDLSVETGGREIESVEGVDALARLPLASELPDAPDEGAQSLPDAAE